MPFVVTAVGLLAIAHRSIHSDGCSIYNTVDGIDAGAVAQHTATKKHLLHPSPRDTLGTRSDRLVTLQRFYNRGLHG
jgi:hypothetical protein